MDYPPGNIPAETKEYLFRQLNEIINSLNFDKGRHDVLFVLPKKPVVGTTYYFGAAIPSTPVTGEGLYVYKSTGFVLIV